MVDPITMMLIGQGVKAAIGGVQAIKGAQTLKNAKRPEYQIPDEIKQNLTDAQLSEIEGLPAAQRNKYIQDIQRNQAAVLKSSGDRMGGISGLGGIADASNQAMGNIFMQDVMARQQAKNRLSQARTEMAGYRDKAYKLNELDPYLNKMQEGQALVGAGTTNAMDAFQSVAGMFMNTAQSGENPEDVYKEGQSSGSIPKGMSLDNFLQVLKGGKGISPQLRNESFMNPRKGFRGETPGFILPNGTYIEE